MIRIKQEGNINFPIYYDKEDKEIKITLIPLYGNIEGEKSKEYEIEDTSPTNNLFIGVDASTFGDLSVGEYKYIISIGDTESNGIALVGDYNQIHKEYTTNANKVKTYNR